MPGGMSKVLLRVPQPTIIMDSSEALEERLIEHAKGLLLPDHKLTGNVCSVKLKNPLCGDEVTYSGVVATDARLSLAVEVSGCFVCKVAASIVANELIAHMLDEGECRLNLFRRGYLGEPAVIEGDLALLYRFKGYPQRTKCVLLPVDVATKLIHHLRAQGSLPNQP